MFVSWGRYRTAILEQTHQRNNLEIPTRYQHAKSNNGYWLGCLYHLHTYVLQRLCNEEDLIGGAL